MADTGFIRKHATVVYFILTIVLSWGAVLLITGLDGLPVPAEQVQLVGMAMLIGPSLAGIGMTAVCGGRAGLRDYWARLTRWRVGLGWYGYALLIAPVTTALTLLVLMPFSSDFAINIVASSDKGGLIVMGVVAGLFVGLFEELGWTGFATPELRRTRSLLATGLIIGVMWGAWHFILFWEADSFAGAFPLALLLARLFTWLIAYRILMVRLHDGTRSLLVTMLMHVSLVASTVIIEPPLTDGNLLAYILVRAALLWVLALAVVVRARGSVEVHQ